MKKWLAMIGSLLIAAIIFIIGNRYAQKEQSIVINEVRSWDTSVLRTGHFGSDYIELYNTTNEAISLHGWYLSDDTEDARKNQIQELVIEAKGYLVLN